MFYGSHHHRHKHHHARQYPISDLSNGYPLYATTLKPMPFPEGQQFQYGYPIFNNMEYVPEEPRRHHVLEYEPAGVPPVHAKANKKKIDEDVDEEAEEFIQHEHKRFMLSKLRSELSG